MSFFFPGPVADTLMAFIQKKGWEVTHIDVGAPDARSPDARALMALFNPHPKVEVATRLGLREAFHTVSNFRHGGGALRATVTPTLQATARAAGDGKTAFSVRHFGSAALDPAAPPQARSPKSIAYAVLRTNRPAAGKIVILPATHLEDTADLRQSVLTALGRKALSPSDGAIVVPHLDRTFQVVFNHKIRIMDCREVVETINMVDLTVRIRLNSGGLNRRVNPGVLELEGSRYDNPSFAVQMEEPFVLACVQQFPDAAGKMRGFPEVAVLFEPPEKPCEVPDVNPFA
jgi:hypothetical protein